MLKLPYYHKTSKQAKDEAVVNQGVDKKKQVISQLVAMAQYSTSADDLEIVCCLFYFHEILEKPNMIQYPIVKRRDFVQLAQSKSKKCS